MAKSSKSALISEPSDNAFVDLGFDDPDLEMAKAVFVMEMASVIKARRMSSARAAGAIGLSQRKLSRLLRGNWKDYSLERLAECLTQLGVTVRLSIERNAGTWEKRRLVVSRAR